MEIEKLFQTSSIAAVREVETKTRHEIEEKKKQLRQVVGDSYRDLISSADTIINISKSCHRLVELTSSLQAGLGDLAGSVAERQQSLPGQQAPAVSSYDRLYALGSRIKYLIDTPETIYGCLDSGEHLAAARRYVRAAEVHRVLTAGQAKQVSQRFPLLQHQWPLVKKFRAQVYTSAGSWLSSHGELSAGQAASTLAAQALLKPMDGAEVLKAFLTSRQAYIMQCLSAATSANADTDLDSLAFIIGDVATMVCAALAQCGELFLQLPGVSATPLLLQALGAEDGSSTDLLFDGGKEAEAWKAHLEGVQGRLAELSAAGLALECSQWLDQLSQQLKQLGSRLLGPCSSGQGLLSVEAAVKTALDSWQYTMQPSSPTAAPEAAGSLAAEPSPEPTAVTMSWNDICQWVLGRPSPLWPLLFEQPLLERAKQLVSQDFSGVVDEVAGLLGAALEEAAALPPSAPGTFQAGSWSDLVELQPATPDAAAAGPISGSKRRRLGSQGMQGVAGRQTGASAGVPAQAWLLRAEHVVQRFDQQLSKALAAALDACSTAGVATAGGRGAELPQAAANRALVLEPFVQDRCAEAVEGIATSLDARLFALPGEAAKDLAAYAPSATQALILGRVALGLASRSSMLPLVLGPPDQWRAAISGKKSGVLDAAGSSRNLWGTAAGARLSGSGLAAAAAAAAPSARFERLQQRLHSVGLQAYGRWADWASTGLAAALMASLNGDHTLEADTPLRAWDETVIGSADGEGLGMDAIEALGGGSLEMRFQLPAAPSPAAVQAALAACQEIDRAGGHLLEDEPLLLFKWRFGGSLLASLTSALAVGADGDPAATDSLLGANGSEQEGDGASSTAAAGNLASRLSEKGVLQLLFDARFLLDLLAGGRPISTGAPDAAGSAAAVTARRREVAQIESALSGRLDPIDWATYEPYLYANKDKAAARCQVLLGMLLRSDKAQQSGGPASGAAVGGSMPADSNILRMAPVGPRFSYLPVSTPVTLLRQSSVHQLQRASSSAHAELARPGLVLASSIGASSSTGSEVSAATYSFADLLVGGGMGSKGAGRQGEEAGDGAASSSMAAAAVGSGMGKLVGSLQGLIGDKAAEVTSAFGDMTGTQGLLSSFARFKQ